MTKNQKIAYSKSKQFISWQAQHMREDTSSLKPAPTEAKKTLLNKAKNAQKEIRTEEKVTALMKFRKKAQERQKKHDELEKATSTRHAAGKNDMKGAIDRLEKSLNKEEVEQIDEISKSTLSSYKDKSTASLKNAQANRDAAEPGKHMSKGFADLHKKSDEIAKKRVKGLKGYLQRKVGMKPVSENSFADPQAATPAPFDGANNTDDTHDILQRKRGLGKTAKKVMSICKPVKEETYDHEKDDKNQISLGKKVPKLDKEDPNALPDGEPKARAVMSGGTTMTGEKRDVVEIDPQMKSRPDLNGNKKDVVPVNKKLENK
jgi:hypothetical protein